MDDAPEVLDAIDDPDVEDTDHPDEISDEDAAEGLALYKSFDDTEDQVIKT